MKRKRTKEILAESFRELAENRQVDKITIQEIVKNCDYSPATFYRHFRDKYDLIAWDYVHRSGRIMDKVGVEDYKWKDTLTDGMKFFLNNKDYMQNLLRNTSGHDAFIRYLSQTNMEHLTNCILRLTGWKKLNTDIEILARIYCFGTVLTVSQWLLDEIKCDSDYLAGIFDEALPEQLRNILE
ncbi:MAG: TetR/AcrR family transcriptional regulator [Lachnospiraceae bacterium]|nr:TetR/AcrR family transcriptional regulator [Lachnospiraceae bacterium]